METMNYNKINKNKPNAGIITFLLVIIFGSAIVIYSMINEPKPKIIGQDAMVNIYKDDDTIETVAEPAKEVKYKVNSRVKTETTGNFKANISLPLVTIDKLEVSDINNQIYSKFEGRYNTLKEENAKSLENKFTYKVTYKKYENKLESGETILSFTIYERIIDDAKGIDTMYKLYGYTVNLQDKVLMTQDDIGPIVLGPTYKTMIREQVKSYIISNKMISESKYNYSMTGLEEFYIKDGKFHIIFNKGDVVNGKYEHLDITINNK